MLAAQAAQHRQHSAASSSSSSSRSSDQTRVLASRGGGGGCRRLEIHYRHKQHSTTRGSPALEVFFSTMRRFRSPPSFTIRYRFSAQLSERLLSSRHRVETLPPLPILPDSTQKVASTCRCGNSTLPARQHATAVCCVLDKSSWRDGRHEDAWLLGLLPSTFGEHLMPPTHS